MTGSYANGRKENVHSVMPSEDFPRESIGITGGASGERGAPGEETRNEEEEALFIVRLDVAALAHRQVAVVMGRQIAAVFFLLGASSPAFSSQ